MSDKINADVAKTHLNVLNQKMNETREDANGILTKFHFGGILVVIGLLNADLVLAKGFDLASIASGLVLSVVKRAIGSPTTYERTNVMAKTPITTGTASRIRRMI